MSLFLLCRLLNRTRGRKDDLSGEKVSLLFFFFFDLKKKNKRRKRLHKSVVENIAKILLIVALNFSRFQTICHVKNVIERGTPWQALQKFHTEQYEVSLRQLHERIRPETKPPHALEIRVRPTAPLQMPLLWSDLEEDVQHTEAYTPETRGERGLRSGYLSITKSDRLNHAFVVLFYLLNSFLFFFFSFFRRSFEVEPSFSFFLFPLCLFFSTPYNVNLYSFARYCCRATFPRHPIEVLLCRLTLCAPMMILRHRSVR